MTRVKICGITRVEDAVAAARLGADAIGLMFYAKSPRAVSADQARRVVRALPPFVATVGVFVDPTPEEVRAALAAVPLHLLQFHGDEPPEFCAQFGVEYLKAARVRPGLDLIQYAARHAGAKALLLDAFVQGTHGGTGQAFDWSLIPGPLPLPLVLSGGLDPGNVAVAVRRVRPWAVDVSSGVEAAKGVKDPQKIAAFIQGVRSADV
ncbi:MAG TPA: phosphoribosylanthranilate isomerase [Burkholderiales bacterium]|nr:phosphoribosylanthranilate isomerase [Burkholderiales bacterium]